METFRFRLDEGGRSAAKGRLDTGSFPAAKTISVIIPVYNGGANFRRCLASLAVAAPPPGEIIVVADGDTDGSRRLATSFGARVLQLDSPGGPARARNAGARAARGDVLFFVDADVAVRPDTLAQVAAAFRREPEVAAVFGSYDDEPAVRGFLSQYKNLFHHYVHQTARGEASTFWGGCGAIGRDAFLAVGGFDESYRRPSIEDIELGHRLRRAGYRIRLDKALQVKHLKRWTAASLLQSDFWCRAVPWTELILRDRMFINDLNVSVSNGIGVLLTYGLLGALVGGWWWSALWGGAAAPGLALLALNAPLYRFFRQKRGLWFAMRAVPWHWLYYLYCGLAVGVGAARHFIFRRRQEPTGFAPRRPVVTAAKGSSREP